LTSKKFAPLQNLAAGGNQAPWITEPEVRTATDKDYHVETSKWKTKYAHLTMFMFAIVIIGLVLMLSPAVAQAQNNDQADAGHQTPEMTEPYGRSPNQTE
jgi:hypothetical protein